MESVGLERRGRPYALDMTTPILRALRGATTCGSDTPEEVAAATQELLVALLERNDVGHDDLVSVLFTTTPDLHVGVPGDRRARRGLRRRAAAVRDGDRRARGDAPVHPRPRPRCTARARRDSLHHVYLRGAQALRDDLPD